MRDIVVVFGEDWSQGSEFILSEGILICRSRDRSRSMSILKRGMLSESLLEMTRGW
jgi:hypothetical protein